MKQQKVEFNGQAKRETESEKWFKQEKNKKKDEIEEKRRKNVHNVVKWCLINLIYRCNELFASFYTNTICSPIQIKINKVSFSVLSLLVVSFIFFCCVFINPN